MITLRRIILDSDLPELNSWYAKYDIPPYKKEDFPKIGYIIPGKAAGFLLQTEINKIGMLDYLIKNREENADAELDAIVMALIKDSKELGMIGVMGFTSNPEVVGRALHLGFSMDNRFYTQIFRRNNNGI